MKKSKLFCTLFLSVVFALVACDPNKGVGNKDKDDKVKKVSDLTLTSITICKNTIPQTELAKPTWPQVNVEHAKTKLDAKTDITATFKYGEKTISPTVTCSKVDLSVGDNTITLSVPASPGNYNAWSHDVVIVRAKGDANFHMVAFKVKEATNPDKWKFAEEKDGNWSMSLPSAIEQIAQADVEVYFTWDGITDPAKRVKLPFTVEGGFPIKLEAGTPKVVNMTVAKDANGIYPEWHGSVTITRSKAELKKIKLASPLITPAKLIKGADLTNKTYDAGTTSAQSINVFFYSEEEVDTEDEGLLKIIETVPPLEKKGKVKTWKLNALTNTLEVKVNDETKMTITVKRNPIELEAISVTTLSASMIAENIQEGENCDTAEAKVDINVTLKQHLKCKAVTVQVNSGAAAPLSPIEVGSSIYSGTISLNKGVNPIIVKVEDVSGVEALGRVVNFTIKKNEQANPSVGPIDEAVQINKLYIGDGKMDKLGVNKFEATVDSADPDKHKFNAKVNKSYKNQQVSLIVEGIDGAKTATISENVAQAGTTLADGQAVFTGAKSYFDVKSNYKKYNFTLTNGDKKAMYEILLDFSIVPEYTITITPPAANGEIKVYTMKAGSRKDFALVDAGSVKTVKVPENQAVYIELIASDPKKPKKLTVDGKDHTEVTTDITKQTPGAIAVKLDKVEKDIAVSGEVGD